MDNMALNRKYYVCCIEGLWIQGIKRWGRVVETLIEAGENEWEVAELLSEWPNKSTRFSLCTMYLKAIASKFQEIKLENWRQDWQQSNWKHGFK